MHSLLHRLLHNPLYNPLCNLLYNLLQKRPNSDARRRWNCDVVVRHTRLRCSRQLHGSRSFRSYR